MYTILYIVCTFILHSYVIITTEKVLHKFKVTIKKKDHGSDGHYHI